MHPTDPAKLAKLQDALDGAAHPGATVRDMFLVSDEDPAAIREMMNRGSADSSSGGPTMLGAVRRRMAGHVTNYFVVVLTDSGTALGRRTLRGGSTRIQEWIHLPAEDLRYELDPAVPPESVRTLGMGKVARGAVAVHLGGRRYAASGWSHARAYKLVGLQGTVRPSPESD